MVKVRGAISGNHPLSEQLIQAILDFKYGRNSKDRVKELFQKELSELIQLQEQLGFARVSTGALGIEDVLRPFTRTLGSLKSYEVIGDLPINRYHYTNTFYRQPKLVSKFPDDASVYKSDKNGLSDDNVLALNHLKNRESRIVVPGPVTFTKLIDNSENVYPSEQEQILETAKYLSKEISSLPENFKEIQFDEPVLAWKNISRSYRESIRDAYTTLKSAAKSRDLIINTYFESSENVVPFLLDLPVDGVGVDLVNTNLLSITDYSFDKKILQAGILDSQNYKPNVDGSLDTSDTKLYSRLTQALVELEPKELILSSNTGLDYLPREIADAKLRQLGEIIKESEE